MEEYLDFAKSLALKSGKMIKDAFDTDYSTRMKEDKTVVTEVDEKINQFVIDEIGKAYPSHSVFGEEKSIDKSSEYAWVCDPIDGTIVFTKGIPISVFSLALVKDGKPLIGVVNDPFTDRLYYANRGGGAFLNEEKIKVSNIKLEHDATIDFSWWPEAEYDIHKVIHDLSIETEALFISIFSIVQSSCLVASGKLEAATFPGTEGKNVDIAAVKVIVEEAGGKVTDLFGEEQRYDKDIRGAIVSNGVVHDKLAEAFSVLKP